MKQNFSNKISSFEAKTHFSQLIKRVKAGEKITILNHNTPIAMLTPIPGQGRLDTQEVIDNLTSFCKGKKISGLSLKDLINEGRR